MPKPSAATSGIRSPASPGRDRVVEVVEATGRVIAREGLEGASLRSIARELGVTTGVLTHYFRDKEDLLGFVLASIFGGLEVGNRTLLDQAPDVDMTIEALMRVLPNSPGSVDWWKVWLAFTVAALSRPERAEAHADKYADLRRYWVKVMRRLQSAGLLKPDIDPVVEAETLVCLVDGIGVQAVISAKALPARKQRTLLRTYFSKIACQG